MEVTCQLREGKSVAAERWQLHVQRNEELQYEHQYFLPHGGFFFGGGVVSVLVACAFFCVNNVLQCRAKKIRS